MYWCICCISHCIRWIPFTNTSRSGVCVTHCYENTALHWTHSTILLLHFDCFLSLSFGFFLFLSFSLLFVIVCNAYSIRILNDFHRVCIIFSFSKWMNFLYRFLFDTVAKFVKFIRRERLYETFAAKDTESIAKKYLSQWWWQRRQ